MLYVDTKAAAKLSEDILKACGTKEAAAGIVVSHLVDNALIGQNAHGLMRVLEYADMIEKGYIVSGAEPSVSKVKDNVIRIDGSSTFGIYAMKIAADELAEALKKYPVATAGVTNVGHTGRIGAYTEYLAKRNFFSVIFGGGAHKRYHTVAPFSGRKGVMSTNPIAMAMPGKDGIPVSADFATASTAGGKLRLARTMGKPLPAGQILDKNGNPSVNADDYFEGGVILPSGGAKGTGLGMICEMLCYAMLGDVHEFNWFMIGFDISQYTAMSEYDKRAVEFLTRVEECPPGPDFDEVVYPGEYEEKTRKKNAVKGLPVDETTFAKLLEKASQKGIDIPSGLQSDCTEKER